MIIHQVWVGGTPPPGIVRLYDAWDSIPSITVRRWYDEDIDAQTDLAALRDRLTNAYPWMHPRGLSDFYRLAILRKYGGIYLDSDTLPLNVDLLAEWDTRRPWIGEQPHRIGKPTLDNAFFGFDADDRFLVEMMTYGFRRLAKGIRNEHFVIGPRTWQSFLDRPEYAHIAVYPTIAEEFFRDLSYPFDITALAAKYPESPVLHTVYTREDVE